MKIVTSDHGRDLLSILLPTYITPLLLPNVVIAEIVEIDSVRSVADGPAWYVGDMDWRGRELPLIAFEAFADLGQSYRVRSNPVVAVVNWVSQAAFPAYGFVCKSIPKLLRISPQDLSDIETVEHTSERIRVMLYNEEAIIPDLEYVESKVQSLALNPL